MGGHAAEGALYGLKPQQDGGAGSSGVNRLLAQDAGEQRRHLDNLGTAMGHMTDRVRRCWDKPLGRGASVPRLGRRILAGQLIDDSAHLLDGADGADALAG